MEPIFTIAGPKSSLHVFGVKLVGVNAETGVKLLLTLLLLGVVWLLRAALQGLIRRFLARPGRATSRFWIRQALQLTLAVVVAVGLLSIWFDDPGRLSTGLGLFGAGLAFALQNVVASLAGYLIILREPAGKPLVPDHLQHLGAPRIACRGLFRVGVRLHRAQ